MLTKIDELSITRNVNRTQWRLQIATDAVNENRPNSSKPKFLSVIFVSHICSLWQEYIFRWFDTFLCHGHFLMGHREKETIRTRIGIIGNRIWHTSQSLHLLHYHGCLCECARVRVFSLNGSIYGYSRCHKLYFVHTKHIRCCVYVCVWIAVQTNFHCLLALPLSLAHFVFSLSPDVCCFRIECKPKYTIQFRLNHHHQHHT